jgi:hypothetical protein
MIKNEQWYKNLHEEMWQWLVDNPKADKDDWPRWKELPLDVREGGFQCFACYLSQAYSNSNDIDCRCCPCWDYEDSYFMCEEPDSPYILWESLGAEHDTQSIDGEWSVDDLKLRIKYALEIKNMWGKD